MTPSPRSRFHPAAAGLLVTAMTLGCMLCGLTAALMLFPDALIGRTSYVTRFQPNQTMALLWKPSDGDVFAALPGRVRPPADDSPYVGFELGWDADGFRVPAAASATYPIAVFGDSFTEGFAVPKPYPDGLAEILGVGVRNYGYRAYGPVEVAQVAEEFAAKEPRTWLIWGFFSGNDMGDALRDPRIDTSTPWAAWGAFFTRFAPPAPTQTPRLGADGQPQYDFPMPVIIGGNYYELAFVPYYWYWQQAPLRGFEASRNYAVVREALEALTTVEASACKALVFIPTKEQLYLPYVHPNSRQFLRAVNQRTRLTDSGALTYVEAPVSDADEPAFFESLYGLRDAMRGLTESQPGWVFIDLLPAFEDAVARGELLYYPYDTHWNQAGHDLAAQVIADAMRATPGC